MGITSPVTPLPCTLVISSNTSVKFGRPANRASVALSGINLPRSRPPHAVCRVLSAPTRRVPCAPTVPFVPWPCSSRAACCLQSDATPASPSVTAVTEYVTVLCLCCDCAVTVTACCLQSDATPHFTNTPAGTKIGEAIDELPPGLQSQAKSMQQLNFTETKAQAQIREAELKRLLKLRQGHNADAAFGGGGVRRATYIYFWGPIRTQKNTKKKTHFPAP